MNVQKTSDRVDVVRCKDCRYYEQDSWGTYGVAPVVIPIIVAHEICTKWGDGCKTSPDGFCFMGERKGDER